MDGFKKGDEVFILPPHKLAGQTGVVGLRFPDGIYSVNMRDGKRALLTGDKIALKPDLLSLRRKNRDEPQSFHKFKVDDTVRILRNAVHAPAGALGRVSKVYGAGEYEVIYGEANTEVFHARSLALHVPEKVALPDESVNTSHPSGIECIQITEHMSFNVGNAVKYLWRADLKGAAIQDLEKAAWYIQREISRRA